MIRGGRLDVRSLPGYLYLSVCIALFALSSAGCTQHDEGGNDVGKAGELEPEQFAFELPDGETWADCWYLLRLGGKESGWKHEHTVRCLDGKRVRFVTLDESWSRTRRGDDVMTDTERTLSIEDAGGRLQSVRSIEEHSGQQPVLKALEVTGDEAFIHTRVLDETSTRTIPWRDDVLGAEGTRRLWRRQGFKKGTRYRLHEFSFEAGGVVEGEVTIEGREEVFLLDGQSRELIRVTNTTSLMPGVEMTGWIDEQGLAGRLLANLGGMKMEIFRTHERRAKQFTRSDDLADMSTLGEFQANVFLPRPYTISEVHYRIEASDDEPIGTSGMDGGNQELRTTDDGNAVLKVRRAEPGRHQQRPIESPPDTLKPFLEANAYIQCDKPEIRQTALRVVSGQNDAWKAAVAMERFVHEHIRGPSYEVDFASALEVFRSGSGDCTESSVLLAAVCRAAGIPARIAVGYVYQGGRFSSHAWTEVWIAGQWYGLDATLAQGRVDPGHIRLAAGSLADTPSKELFLPSMSAMKNLEISIQAFVHQGKLVTVDERFKDHRMDDSGYRNPYHAIRVTPPAGTKLVERRSHSDPDTLLFFEGKTPAALKVFRNPPWKNPCHEDELHEEVEAAGGIFSGVIPMDVEKLRVCGREALAVSWNGAKPLRQLWICDGDTLFILEMPFEGAHWNKKAFDALASSIHFERTGNDPHGRSPD